MLLFDGPFFLSDKYQAIFLEKDGSELIRGKLISNEACNKIKFFKFRKEWPLMKQTWITEIYYLIFSVGKNIRIIHYDYQENIIHSIRCILRIFWSWEVLNIKYIGKKIEVQGSVLFLILEDGIISYTMQMARYLPFIREKRHTPCKSSPRETSINSLGQHRVSPWHGKTFAKLAISKHQN